jgi:hypothetical protein
VIAFFAVVSFFAVGLIVPGWLWFRRSQSQSQWLLVLPPVGVLFWVTLTALGIGPQSLSNVLEVFFVAVSAVLSVYFKFLVLDRVLSLPSRGTTVPFFIVGAVALGLRLLMPALPE